MTTRFAARWSMCAIALAGALVLAMATSAQAAKVVTVYQLMSHPDGTAAPPTYGLRLDNLYLQTPTSGSASNTVGGTTTFGFVDVKLTVTEDTVSGDISININGDVNGGVDIGGGYGYGAGDYTINFDYDFNVQASGGGWLVSPQDAGNQGTITAGAGITDIDQGTTWTFYEEEGTGNPFKFVPDGHRLTGDDSTFVGRGWVTYDSGGTGVGGAQDWLFKAPVDPEITLVPVPAAAWMGLSLLGTMGGVRVLRSSKRDRG